MDYASSGLKGQETGGGDRILALVIFTLLLVGLVMVYSAGAIHSLEEYKDSAFLLKRQLLCLAVGGACMFFFCYWDYQKLGRCTPWIVMAALVLLILLMIPGMGRTAGGATRWLAFGGVGIQPSEVAKFSFVVFVARSLAKKKEKLGHFVDGFLPKLIVIGAYSALILSQRDFGTAMIIIGVAFAMFLLGGVDEKFLAGYVAAALTAAVFAVMAWPYRVKRVLTFLDPWQDASDSGFQLVQSFYAFGHGGLMGTGLGNGRQKLFYLPEAHTDFIFSVIGEETGLLGAAIVAALFVAFVWRGFKVALSAPDTFGANLAAGLTILIGGQALTNMLVAVGMLPTKGLTLPFISVGGSSLVMSMIAAGVLLNISRQAAAH